MNKYIQGDIVMSAKKPSTLFITLLCLLSSLNGLALASGTDSTGMVILASNDQNMPSITAASTQSNLPQAPAEASVSFFDQDRLVGGFSGLKQSLSAAGIDYSFSYRSDNLSNISGGNSSGHSYIYQFDYAATINLDRSFGWTGATADVQGLSNNGTSIKQFSGDAQGPSNLEAFHTTKLYQAWVEQKFFNGDASLRVGLYDLNSEFYVTNGSGLFLNSSFGVGIDLAQSGAAGPSIFPNTSFAVRAKAQISPALSLQAAVIDGIPGAPGEPTATGFSISRQDGALLITEAGYAFEPSSIVGQTNINVGIWRYTSSFADLTQTDADGNSVLRSDNAGVYVSASRQIYTSSVNSSEGLVAFIRYGRANGAINPFSHNLACGLVYTGLIPGRESDVCGAAFTRAQTSDAYQAAAAATGDPLPGTESTIEVSYRLNPAAWCALQFDLQHIMNPGTTGTLPDATIGGMRLELQF
jgi:porin